jgi:hypothetical protein
VIADEVLLSRSIRNRCCLSSIAAAGSLYSGGVLRKVDEKRTNDRHERCSGMIICTLSMSSIIPKTTSSLELRNEIVGAD